MKIKILILVFSLAVILSVAATPVWQSVTRFASILVTGNATIGGTLDMDSGPITNIGVAGTDFSSTGGLALADDLDMSAQPIVNIGASGTDFGTDGSLTTAAGVTISDGNAVIADFARLTPQTTITVTDGGIITPTGSYQPLTAAGGVGAALSTGCTAGNLVMFINTVAQTITISDTTPGVLSSDAALAQYDALTLLCDGTRWIQVAAESDN